MIGLRQRADYTHRFNAGAGRHGWLRLTPAYSVKIVDELIAEYDTPRRVLDPFCGTATTALSAAYCGHQGSTTDINPFLVWFGRVKTARYSEATVSAARLAGMGAADAVARNAVEPVAKPAIHNIDRWWRREAAAFLCALRAAIEGHTEQHSAERDLLLVAFCRTLIALSNAAFNHQSMSFKDDTQLAMFEPDMERRFRTDLHFVLDGAEANPPGTSEVVLGDARDVGRAVDGLFDLVITSPPYANRMSYIRELRPYMYWLGFLANGRQAGELDWSAIGGTWGVATSRLSGWEPPEGAFRHALLDKPLGRIANASNRNGVLLARYVARYFADIWDHISSLTASVRPGCRFHYIVGNSTFYGVLLSVERIYAAMFEAAGFEDVRCRAIRKRNSKKELFEFDVSGRWPG